ncbi:hypothetical protein EUGRSUZ_E00042 [Eucalyptus grandis]|uniref:Uncharacterized protein n=2 Tax=Eucalyptus grandis TaxID=71139 RepID=A0ACC3KQ84_EUCGR|nr:hypothetical protein EUGRSUZ_E00042 [Eucalyptus grandis]
MAAAEARAVWQRTANRYFVQEDAKRAPKLACCQSSSSTSKQVDAGPAGSTEEGDRFGLGFMPFNRKPSFTNLPPEARWWLQQQPSSRFPRGLACEGLNALDAEVDLLNASTEDLKSICGEMQKEGAYMHVENEKKDKLENLHDAGGSNPVIMGLCSKDAKEVENMDMMESFELIEMNHAAMSASKQTSELSFDLDSAWTRNGKPEPWWRISDKNELASFVAKKSLDHVENCDLPPPQNMHARKHPYSYIGCLDYDEVFETSSDWKVDPLGTLGETIQARSSPEYDQMLRRQWAPDEDGHFPRGFDNSSSYDSARKGKTETWEATDCDPAKSQLLEALCYSQTRAREAEKAAEQARAEKEHIVKLFFRQASQLFAYKQWFQLLQLETTLLQMDTDGPIFPVFLPLGPSKGRKMRKSCDKASKARQGRRKRQKHDVTKYAVVFAVGLGLVGAGLLLGWTVGWMIPLF